MEHAHVEHIENNVIIHYKMYTDVKHDYIATYSICSINAILHVQDHLTSCSPSFFHPLIQFLIGENMK